MKAKYLLPFLLLTACAAPEAASDVHAEPAVETSSVASPIEGLAPIRQFLSCLPERSALIAAHRGTGDFLGAPENSLSGLQALIDRGVMMAEIDIAKIQDGTLISYHDGVWEMKSSGVGPVVATSAADFARIRLRLEENGTIGGEAVPTLAEMLDMANDRIYLELDFKSSADIERVVEMVRERDMTDQVVLIAITDEEAELLLPYADEMILSLPRSFQDDPRAVGNGVWVSGGWRDGAERNLPDGVLAIGSQWDANGEDGATPLDILVTDQITRMDPLPGIADIAAFEACLRD